MAAFAVSLGRQPAIRWLENRGLQRGAALAVLILAGLLAMTGAPLAVVPVIIDQAARAFERLPEIWEDLQGRSGIIGDLANRFGAGLPVDFDPVAVVGLAAGVTSFIVFTAIGLPYALALATWVALMDLIPAIGALIGMIPVVVVASQVGVRDAVQPSAPLTFLSCVNLATYMWPDLRKNGIGGGVAAQREPAPASVLVEPALGDFTLGVAAEKAAIQVDRIGIGELLRDRWDLGVAELLDRAAPALRTSQKQHLLRPRG